jgi:hypothetical protein
LHFKGAFVDAAVHDTIKTRAALIKERRRSEIGIASVNRWATGQQGMSRCRSTVVLKWPKQRIGIDLVAGAVEHS